MPRQAGKFPVGVCTPLCVRRLAQARGHRADGCTMFGILYGRTVRLCYEHLISFRLVLGVGSQIPDENVISGGFYIMMQQ